MDFHGFSPENCRFWSEFQLEAVFLEGGQVRLWCLARPDSDEEGSDFDDMGGALENALLEWVLMAFNGLLIAIL